MASVVFVVYDSSLRTKKAISIVSSLLYRVDSCVFVGTIKDRIFEDLKEKISSLGKKNSGFMLVKINRKKFRGIEVFAFGSAKRSQYIQSLISQESKLKSNKGVFVQKSFKTKARRIFNSKKN